MGGTATLVSALVLAFASTLGKAMAKPLTRVTIHSAQTARLNVWNCCIRFSFFRTSTTVAHSACTAIRMIARRPLIPWTSNVMPPA